MVVKSVSGSPAAVAASEVPESIWSPAEAQSVAKLAAGVKADLAAGKSLASRCSFPVTVNVSDAKGHVKHQTVKNAKQLDTLFKLQPDLAKNLAAAIAEGGPQDVGDRGFMLGNGVAWLQPADGKTPAGISSLNLETKKSGWSP